jgi:hypothetical protein
MDAKRVKEHEAAGVRQISAIRVTSFRRRNALIATALAAAVGLQHPADAQTDTPPASKADVSQNLSPAEQQLLQQMAVIAHEQLDWAKQRSALLDQQVADLHLDQIISPEVLSDFDARQAARRKLDAFQQALDDRNSYFYEADQRLRAAVSTFEPRYQAVVLRSYDAAFAVSKEIFEKHMATQTALRRKFGEILDLCDAAPGGLYLNGDVLTFADPNNLAAYQNALLELQQIIDVDRHEVEEASKVIAASKNGLGTSGTRAP